MLTRSKLAILCLCTLVLFCSPSLYSQANGSFSGTVSDKTGSVVSHATVSIASQGTGVSREARTDGSGRYLVPLLPVATYTIRVESQGFQTAEQRDIRLQVAEQREVNFTLAPASVSQSVEVSANVVAVETANATLGQVITSEEVASLPLNGRNFVQLATLTPGVSQETNPNSFFNGGAASETSARGTYSLSVGGSRPQSTDWLLDNNDNNELSSGGISILPSMDAIQEFKVLTFNYSAEYGTRAGPTVLVTTKSGSNDLHGSLFEYFRNTQLDARSFFASSREQFNLNQFGGSLGGPIKKNKTYFFVDYQGKHQRHGIPFIGLVPTRDMMNGDFTEDPLGNARGSSTFPNIMNPFGTASAPNVPTRFMCDDSGNPVAPDTNGYQDGGTACNKIPQAMFDSAGAQMIKLYPQANAINSSTVTNYANVPVRKLDEGSFDIRMDHNFSSKDSVFARFSYDQANSYVPGGAPGFAEASPFASNQMISNHSRNVALTETHIFSDRMVNQFNAGYNRIFNHISSYGEYSGQLCEAAAVGIENADLGDVCTGAPVGQSQSTKDCLSCGLTATQLGQYWSLGDRPFAPFQGGTNVFSFSDTLDLIRGQHDIHLGFGFRDNQLNLMTNGYQDGYFLLNAGSSSFTGDDAADLLMGQVSGAIHDQTFYGATTGRRWKMMRPFIQDDWRVSSNLTVNVGLAWALVTPETEAQGRQANFNFDTGQFLVAGPASITGCASCVRTDGRVGIKFDKTALEPRIGLSWKPWGQQNTVVRAGYAINHDSAWAQGAAGLWQNPPYFAESDNFNYYPYTPATKTTPAVPGNPCPYGNTTADCGLRRSFLPGFTAPPNPDSFTGTIQSQDLDFKQGMVQQFNLNVEHQFAGNLVVTAGYAGARSTHILNDGMNMNVATPSACDPTSANYDSSYTLGCAPGGARAVPYSQYSIIANITDNGRARYDSLQIKAETKSARQGLYALIGYTWSRTFDSGMADNDGTYAGATYWPLPGASKLDWGLSQMNLSDQFTASVLYDLPVGRGKRFGSSMNRVGNAVLGDWKVTAIEKITTGFPLFVVASANQSGVDFQWNGSSLNRPNQVGDPNRPGTVEANPTCDAPSQVHTREHWFNPCAFMDPPAGQLGNASRTPVNGPRFVNTDFSALKVFPLSFRPGMTLQFRAEFFNLFNHAQYYLGGGGTGMQDVDMPSTFGVINGTVNNPRVVQFALRLAM